MCVLIITAQQGYLIWRSKNCSVYLITFRVTCHYGCWGSIRKDRCHLRLRSEREVPKVGVEKRKGQYSKTSIKVHISFWPAVLSAQSWAIYVRRWWSAARTILNTTVFVFSKCGETTKWLPYEPLKKDVGSAHDHECILLNNLHEHFEPANL